VAVAIVAAAFLSNRLTLKTHPAATTPVFHRLSFGRGTIWGARFAPDGGTIVYSAAWTGDKPRLFTVREDNLFSTQLTLPPAILFGMSSQSELALGREPKFETTLLLSGTLARSPLSGGAPRDIEEKVAFADWAPNGQSVAVARDIGGRFAVFYPEDHLLYQGSGWISHLRFSPDGKQLAFLDHPPQGDSGDVIVVATDGRGKPRTLASGFVSVQGLVWRPDGGEVWVTGTRTGISRALEAITLSGTERTVCRVPATFTLYDLLKDGRALIAEEDYRESLFAGGRGDAPARDLSALDWAGPGGLSPDGTLVSFDETGEGGGDNGVIYLRRMDGSPPVRLGSGIAGGFSPDGQWVATMGFDGRSVTVYPTGAGKPKTISIPVLAGRPQFVSGGREIEFRGVEKGQGPRIYVLNLESGKIRPISEAGVPSTTYAPGSPDGRNILALAREAGPAIYPVAGGEVKPVAGAEHGDYPAGWSDDGKSVYVYRRGESPVHVFRIDVATGKRTLWKQIAPPDPAGITGIAPVIVSADGSAYVYGATRILSTLYLVEGLK
jgi:DNA-binding beta-propeller fold protein YncE